MIAFNINGEFCGSGNCPNDSPIGPFFPKPKIWTVNNAVHNPTPSLPPDLPQKFLIWSSLLLVIFYSLNSLVPLPWKWHKIWKQSLRQEDSWTLTPDSLFPWAFIKNVFKMPVLKLLSTCRYCNNEAALWCEYTQERPSPRSMFCASYPCIFHYNLFLFLLPSLSLPVSQPACRQCATPTDKKVRRILNKLF